MTLPLIGGENAQEETSINLENDFSHFEGIWYYDG